MDSSKVNNRQRVLRLMRNNQEMSISDVSETVRASKPTVKKVLDFYVESELLTVAGKGQSGDEGGKRPLLYRFNPDFGFFICVHLGPGFIYAALMNLDYKILKSSYTEVELVSITDFERRLIRIIETFLDIENGGGCRIYGLVIGMPGIVNERSGESVFSPHYPDWPMHYPLKENLEERYTDRLKIYIDNINRYEALAEMEMGEAKGKHSFMTVDALSEGVGSGVIVNGELRHGAHSFSGEIGHMVLDSFSDEGCICGGRGCFETLVSERRILKLISEGLGRFPDSEIRDMDKNLSGFEKVFAASGNGDPLGIELLDDLVFWFSVGLNNIIMINDPELIVIQGIFSRAGEPFLTKLKRAVREKAYIHLKRDIEIKYSNLGDERGVLGCGVYGVMKFFENRKLYTGDVMDLG